jgi:DNA primase
VATPKEIVYAFDRFCKNNGLRNPYSNASIFGERLKNDRHLLEKTGWELVSRKNVEPYWKIINGVRFWKFRKTIVR